MAVETKEQRDELEKVGNYFKGQFGGPAWYTLCNEATSWKDKTSADWYDTYNYAIKIARAKLEAPVITLDPSEYEDTMKFTDLMEEYS